MTGKDSTDTAPITIKKYANRRLYNTATSSYVTLDHLCQMVKDSADFVVYDAKTGEDITRSVLTHIIVEEEAKGHNLLPISFLRQLISLYGDNMQWMVPRYLEYSMQVFARNQEQIRAYFQETVSGLFPFGALEEMGKQNVAMMERAMRMFTPFAAPSGGSAGSGDTAQAPTVADLTMDELQARLSELQEQIRMVKQLTGSKPKEQAATPVKERVEQAK
ncbi:MAG: polyhydroxyalkanoate synthesis repressor PhaR [Rhodospirillaceae bacterium]|nr:polyhydroxyalkanoate synthesis repressor PhaR [Rhodospirillaceae bacterium]